ncbi:MAG: TetR/AcrR family transcriptional regulator, partial [Oscillospiraceae bacterium]|nr:TetR/AcrR family transcriptional regulator [Oscillospiraceae bacterium]
MENHTRNSTQAAIQEKARELFLKKGYAETTVRDIAQATGLTAGSIYRYFKGKKELFDSLDIPEMELVRPEYEKKRADTLRIALDLFGQKGFEGTTMDEIAVACGVSKATLY